MDFPKCCVAHVHEAGAATEFSVEDAARIYCRLAAAAQINSSIVYLEVAEL